MITIHESVLMLMAVMFFIDGVLSGIIAPIITRKMQKKFIEEKHELYENYKEARAKELDREIEFFKELKNDTLKSLDSEKKQIDKKRTQLKHNK